MHPGPERGGLRLFLSGMFPALTAGVLFALLFPPPFSPDDDGYLPIARGIASGRGWVGPMGLPQAYRPPLFSLLLGSWFAATGHEGTFSVGVFQSLMLGLAAGVACLLARRCGASASWSVASGLLFGLHPFVFTNVGFVHQEFTLALLTGLSCLATVGFLSLPRPSRAMASGIAWGLSILGKVVTLFAPLLALLLLWRARVSRRSSRPALAAVLLLATVGVVGPWTVRNALRFHRFILVNEEEVGVLEWLVAGGSPGEQGTSRQNEDGIAFVRENRARVEARGDLDAAGKKWNLALALLGYLAAHPAYLARASLENAVRFTGLERAWFRDNGSWPGGSYGPLYWILYLLLQAPLFGGALLRGFLGWRRDGSDLRFLFCFILLYWGVHVIIWGQPRYALPLYPVLAALGASLPAWWGACTEGAEPPGRSLTGVTP